MTTPAARENQSPLEAALSDVHATLTELLAVADEQYAAVVAGDRDAIESVTWQQERLSARLARAETRRQELLGGSSLSSAVSNLSDPGWARVQSTWSAIADAVIELKRRQAQTADLLQHTIQATQHTVEFLQRLVAPTSPVYGARGLTAARASIMVDGRA